MFEKFIPQPFLDALNKINFKQLNEIRFRAYKPVVVYLGGMAYFLSNNGISTNIKEALTCDKESLEEIVFRASECSIYAVNEQIKNGFLTVSGGFRIGLGGTAVFEGDKLKTIKNFVSLNIRVPHIVKDCSLTAFKYILENKRLNNTLIISPPGAGKTTFLKDFVYQLSQRNFSANVLVLDERGEIASINEKGESLLESNFCDVLSFMPKPLGINFGIRALAPNLILTDELGSKEDVEALYHAGNCGVNVIASIHAASLLDLKKKIEFSSILKDKFFTRFVILSSREGPGTYEGIFDENFERIL
ncbi:MAG: hypothetical protein MR024_02415 [Firmicutes bacterium]|nr:hypothetical protein [Bacillota bacterium]